MFKLISAAKLSLQGSMHFNKAVAETFMLTKTLKPHVSLSLGKRGPPERTLK